MQAKNMAPDHKLAGKYESTLGANSSIILLYFDMAPPPPLGFGSFADALATIPVRIYAMVTSMVCNFPFRLSADWKTERTSLAIVRRVEMTWSLAVGDAFNMR